MTTVPDPPTAPPAPADVRNLLRAQLAARPESADSVRRSRNARAMLDAKPAERRRFFEYRSWTRRQRAGQR